MRLMLYFFRAYPWQSAVMLFALLFAGIAEGVGLSALLPLLNVAIQTSGPNSGEAQHENEFARVVTETLARFHVQPTLGTLLVIIVAGVTLKSLLLLVANRQVGYTAAQVATDARLELLRAILKCKWEHFVGQPTGHFTNSMVSEATRSSDAFVNGATVITFVIQAVIYGCVAIALSWQAMLITVAVGTLIMGISHGLVRMAKRAGKKQTELLKSMVSRLTDTLQSVKPLKAMARDHLADSVLSIETARLNKALRKQVFSNALLNGAQEEMFAIVIAIGMYIALSKLGMAFPTVLVLAAVLGRMLAQLGKVQKQYQKMAMSESAFWSMRATIDAATQAMEHLSTGAPPTLDSAIALRDVKFSYDRRLVLDGLSLDIPAGTLVTLFGPSGSGKTTVVDLIIGLLRQSAGEVLIDGKPLQSLDQKQWRRMLGYVPQETLLLHDSILHNVTLGDPELTEADAEAALRAAGAWEFAVQMPMGIHTTVGERGGKVSGGQRQRIVIARALVNQPKLLILDEATSALDPVSEQAVKQTLQSLRGQLTILAISHQPALVEAADVVYRLEHGKAVQVDREAVAGDRR